MHLRMDRMKTLRWLLVFTAFIYFTERGVEKMLKPVNKLVTQTFQEATTFVMIMSEESEKDRLAAEEFQPRLDKRNRLSEKRFQWKRPKGKSLEDRPDEFRVEKDKNGKIIGVYTAKPKDTIPKVDTSAAVDGSRTLATNNEINLDR